MLLLHGFTESARVWDALVDAWAGSLRVIAVDLIGHGRSDAPDDPSRYTLERAVADLRSLLDALGITRAHLVGYSLGGRVALRFALDAPERSGALVLVSASAGIADAAERAARLAHDEALAGRIERDGLAAFVAEWEAQDLFATERALPDARRALIQRERLAQRPQGIANSLRGMGQGAMVPLWDRLGALRAPALLVTGARDARYGAIGTRMASAMRHARHVALSDAGHGAHRERPAELAALVGEFLRGAAAARAIGTTVEVVS